jgi:predicted phosphoribosyltransferase
MRFINRQDAGRWLAEDLASRSFERPVIVGLPRGGVPVAAEIAARLNAPLDVLVVRKLGYPARPELGIGAIAEGGMRILNHDLIARLGVTPEQVDGVAAIEEAELRRRVRRYRADRPPLAVSRRTAILVDDGLATGFTARAGIEVLRRQGAHRVVLAVPIGPAVTVEELGTYADQVICVQTPSFFVAIGRWYTDFRPVSDAEVADLLQKHAVVPSGGSR